MVLQPKTSQSEAKYSYIDYGTLPPANIHIHFNLIVEAQVNMMKVPLDTIKVENILEVNWSAID